jgi:hypothetical protein
MASSSRPVPFSRAPHPFDAAAADLAFHSVAVLIVVGAARAVGSRTLQNSFVAL